MTKINNTRVDSNPNSRIRFNKETYQLDKMSLQELRALEVNMADGIASMKIQLIKDSANKGVKTALGIAKQNLALVQLRIGTQKRNIQKGWFEEFYERAVSRLDQTTISVLVTETNKEMDKYL